MILFLGECYDAKRQIQGLTSFLSLGLLGKT